MRMLAAHCEPDAYEGRIYQKWMRDHSFRADTDPKQMPFALVMPPPDVNNPLHLGQAFSLTVQDMLIRRMRMLGCSARWLPCADTADLPEKEDTSAPADPTDLRLFRQMMKLGCSCDWENIQNTTDAACRAAAKTAFVNDYEDGFLYRGKHVAEWCPQCRMPLCAADLSSSAEQGTSFQLRFPFADGTGYLFLMTTEPETLLADAAAAVNQKDIRYQNIIGKNVILPLSGREIPVIADSTVPMDSGTGVRRVTPAFDAHAYEIAGKRGLAVTELLTAEGTVSAEFGAFAGKTKAELREAMLTALKDGGFLVKSEPCSIRKTVCRRCGGEVTKRIAAQWFLRSREFAEPAAEALRSGDLRIMPEQYTARCTERLTDARDQRISRHAQQGIPVPAFYCEACGKMTVTESESALCPECGQPMQPDPDTLETGFAASLLPFALLGYPERTDDLQYYYPADTLVTGYDLVTPWVSGMLAAAMRQTDQMPFRQVLLHGLVRDSSGKKVTSARKNGYDPMALIEDYGADALRYALIARSAVGKDIRLSEAQVIAAKRLAEKLWNCARFVLRSVSGTFRYAGLPASLRIEEQWIVSRCNQLAGDVDADMERGAYGAAAERIGRFIRRTFSGTYLALAGARLRADVSGRAAAEQVLVWVLRRILCMMHPFMPFVTEEIWQALTDCESAVIAAEYPVYQSVLDFSQEADDFEHVLEALRAVKRSRKALHIPETLRAKFYFETMDVDLFSASRFFFEQLAGAREIEFGQDYRFRNAIHVVTDRAHIAIPLEQPLIRDREHARLMEEAELLRREAEQVQALLHQSGFTEKAPEQVVRAARERRAVLRERLVRLVKALS